MDNETEQFDAIVIGTGQGGGPLAVALAGAGWKVAIIERMYVGGTCINYGCTPTKTMVASARVAHLVGRAADYGIQIPAFSVNLKKVRDRKRSIVESFRNGSQNRLESAENMELIFGEARFSGEKQVDISMKNGDFRRLYANKIFINTGASPRILPIEGLSEIEYLDSTSIMELDKVPEHLIIIGGGYVGLEFGQMFRRFGSRVTIIQRSDQLLPREDADVAEEVADILREEGIEIYLDSQTEKVERLSSNEIKLTIQSSGNIDTLTGTHLLLAAGRVPNTADLNLSATGVETNDRGYIRTDDRLETNVSGIFALGDVKPGPAFTHISYDDSRIIKTNLLEGGNSTVNGRMVPYTVFIDPQLGRVGLSESEAREQGRKIRVAKIPMEHVARALETDETRGFMKAIVDADTDQILGCAILGIEGGEIMSILQVAMMGKVPYYQIRDGVFAHPTLAESLNNLFLSMK